ncbi:Translin-1 [Tieghemiomyces parasiticus]|uniref:Translin-1 n=1 Tax=Tieghemiomyces parasiticus TaxID=78921 RepID=A0A9W8ALF0_9FUNG|nr:Translin-1 [Tieghemiomyces parasiticus]
MDTQALAELQRSIQSRVEVEDAIRAHAKDLETACRSLSVPLSRIHVAKTDEEQDLIQFPNPSPNAYPHLDLQTVIRDTTPLFQPVRDHLQGISAAFPIAQFYRYNHLWSRSVQQAIFAAALLAYFEHKSLIMPEEIQGYLGVPVKVDNEPVAMFHLTLEEYLHGIFSLPSELARFAINSVTYQAYQRPLEISQFVAGLFSSFQVLNLKNDSIRKHFDSIKLGRRQVRNIDVCRYAGAVKPVTGHTQGAGNVDDGGQPAAMRRAETILLIVGK